MDSAAQAKFDSLYRQFSQEAFSASLRSLLLKYYKTGVQHGKASAAKEQNRLLTRVQEFANSLLGEQEGAEADAEPEEPEREEAEAGGSPTNYASSETEGPEHSGEEEDSAGDAEVAPSEETQALCGKCGRVCDPVVIGAKKTQANGRRVGGTFCSAYCALQDPDARQCDNCDQIIHWRGLRSHLRNCAPANTQQKEVSRRGKRGSKSAAKGSSRKKRKRTPVPLVGAPTTPRHRRPS